MKILVCIKQVPIVEELLELDTEKKWLSDTDVEYRINRFDEFAIEEALLIKETTKGTTVDVISFGPQRVETVLRRAMGMGADNGIHIEDETEGFINPLTIATLIGQYAQNNDYDLIFTGIMSEDSMQSLVGPMLASYLNLPCAVSVVETKLDEKTEKISVKCELEGGHYQNVRLNLPSVSTIQSGINKPRYPSLSNMLRANKQDLINIDINSLKKPQTNEKILNISLPERSKKIKFLEGSMEEKAEELIQLLHKKAILRGNL
ncbi:MAG: electron transfer flavoprotein subunit beta/FixA family protein [Deltaproteobacteria bacterium]|nr:electron transfer flavoprotein subunit beta/FixA family protein [Deltaproteobacteria bacterium]